MKEIIYLIILLIVVNLLMELFIGDAKLGKFIRFSFSAVLVFAVFFNVCNIFLKDDFLEEIVTNEETIVDMSYFEEQVVSMEKIIENRLNLEFENVFDVHIDYLVEGSTIVYKNVLVKYNSLENIDEDIKKVVKTYVDCEVVCNGG